MKREHSLSLPSPISNFEQVENKSRVVRRGAALSPALSIVLQQAQREIGLLRAENFDESSISSEELINIVNLVAERSGFELSSYERDEIIIHIEKDQNQFGILQELVENESVSDLIVTDYSRVSVQEGRTNYNSDISFSSPEVYEAFVERLLLKAGTTYSTKKPIADGMIGNFARIHAVHKSICESGPYLTIRLNRFSSVGAEDLVASGLAPIEILDYLRAAVQIGQTVLVVGEVSTGKTTLTRALASSMPSDEAVLVIEDTPEIQLNHPHVRYMRTRESNSDGAGRVSPGECIRGGMRMAMSRIIFGEMRDAEAAEAFIDVCASGHPGLSTIHGRSSSEAITRLELFLGRVQKGVERQMIAEQIATAVKIICFCGFCPLTKKRRIMEVKEIGPVADGRLREREMFRYQLRNSLPAWRVVNRLSSYKEALERTDFSVSLNSLPDFIELNLMKARCESKILYSN